MSLADRLLALPPRERAGSRSANRFDYQLDWALCHLLDLHEQDQDYVLIIDYHDDVLVLDSASNPEKVYFYQIKTTTSGNWTTTRLVARKRGAHGPLHSILGKLYQHYIDFGDSVGGLYFVTNAPLSLTTDGGGRTTSGDGFTFSSLGSKDRDRVCTALESECSLNGAPADLSKIHYQRSPLPPSGHSQQALGKLVEFLERIPEARSVPEPAFYRTLKMELARTLHFEGTPQAFSDLCECKAITRGRFLDMLAEACQESHHTEHIEAICHRLNDERVPFSDVANIRRMIRRFSVERLDPTNALLGDSVNHLQEIISDAPIHDGLWDTIEAIRKSPQCQELGIEADRGRAYVRAMIGVLLHESTELSNADSDASEAQT